MKRRLDVISIKACIPQFSELTVNMVVRRLKWSQLLILMAATILFAANWHTETHDLGCAGPFRSWICGIGNRANICAIEVVDLSVKLPFARSRFPPPERYFLRIGDRREPLVNVRLDKLLRWLGSVMLIVLSVVGYGTPWSVPVVHRRKPAVNANET